MATDFVQGMVLFPVTILMAWLAWREVGGWDGFVAGFQRPEVATDFRLVKEPGQFPEDRFTWKWILVIFVVQLHAQLSIASAGRYLSTKDGSEARKAAWLSGALMLVGTIVWFIPPMVARFLYSEEIATLPGNQAESAYAYIALKLLPAGLVGVMIAAMFAATMSSMDTGLNEQAGIIVRNLAPRLRQAKGRSPLSHDQEVLICRTTTLILGVIVISVSLLLSAQRDFPLFDAYLVLGSTVAIPLGFPLLVGLWVRRLPTWAYAAICTACLLPSAYAHYDQKINGVTWTVQDRALWIFGFGLAATLVSVAFARHAPAEHRERENAFFATMRRPVDFAAEIGTGTDRAQLLLLGNTVLATAGLLALLLLLPNSVSARSGILFVVGFTFVVGVALRWSASRTRD
jgi:Na+/proline symporter